MKGRFSFAVAALVICVAGRWAEAQTLTLINPGTDDRIATITGLTISGTTYDITFHHGVSFLTAPGLGGLTFTNNAAAVTAAAAIQTFIASTNTAYGGTFTSEYRVPYTEGNGMGGGQVNYAGASENSTGTPYNFPLAVGGNTPPSTVLGASQAWVSFTQSSAVIPEPGSIALAGLLGSFAGAGYWFRRRKPEVEGSDREQSATV